MVCRARSRSFLFRDRSARANHLLGLADFLRARPCLLPSEPLHTPARANTDVVSSFHKHKVFLRTKCDQMISMEPILSPLLSGGNFACLFARAAFCVLAIEEARQQNAMFAPQRPDERHSATGALRMLIFEIVQAESKFDGARGLAVARRMESKRDLAGGKFAPARRLELE